MDLDDTGLQIKYLIRDRDGKYPALFDAILADADITVVLSGVRMPRMNSIMERWIQSCRHELLDRTLIFNQTHLLWALREYERHHNRHRPHRGIESRPEPFALYVEAARSYGSSVREQDSTAPTVTAPKCCVACEHGDLGKPLEDLSGRRALDLEVALAAEDVVPTSAVRSARVKHLLAHASDVSSRRKMV
jgi:hypothetical protein